MPGPTRAIGDLPRRALERRRALLDDDATDCWRLFHGGADGLPGVFVDRYGPGLALIVHLGTPGAPDDPGPLADAFLRVTEPLGVTSVYWKPFVRDRSALGGQHDDAMSDPTPLVGAALPEAVVVREHGVPFEVRLYDGFSTGLFLDQRENRRALGEVVRGRPGARVLNTFCYTGGFSACCARAGASTTSVDVSARYLDWTKRNLALSGIDPEAHRFARMGTMEFLAMAQRRGLLFDLVVLDPPTFGSADKRRGVAAWSAERDYPALLDAASSVLDPGGLGLLFCSTNARALCEGDRFSRMIRAALGPGARFLDLPARPIDFPPGDLFPACALVSPAASGRSRRTRDGSPSRG